MDAQHPAGFVIHDRPTWDLDDPRWDLQAQALLARFHDNVEEPTPHEFIDLPSHPRQFILPANHAFEIDRPGRPGVPAPSTNALAWWSQAVMPYNKSVCKWDNMSQEILHYVAGQLDSDGNVFAQSDHSKTIYDNDPNVANSSTRISLQKAENAYSVLYVMKYLFGGAVINGPAQRGQQQAQRVWELSGYAAWEMAFQMSEYSCIKRNQYELLASYKFGIAHLKRNSPCARFDPDSREVTYFSSLGEAARELGVTHGNIAKAADNYLSFRGCYYLRLPSPTSITAKQEVDRVRNGLKDLKKVKHVDVEEELNPCYVAGFIDGDGCLCLTSTGSKIYSVAQRWPQICLALKRDYGGRVSKHQQNPNPIYTWTAHAAGRQVIEDDIFPFLIEKYAQGQIILNTSAKTRDSDRKALKRLKGHSLKIQGPPDANGVERYINFDVDEIELLAMDQNAPQI